MKQNGWEDPIVAEVHRIRLDIAAECRDDLHTYLAGLMAEQAGTVSGAELRQHGDSSLSPNPR